MKVQKFIINYFRIKIKLLSLLSQKSASLNAFKIFCTPFFRTLYRPEQILNAEALHYHFEDQSIHGYRWNKGANKKALIVHGYRSALCNLEHFAHKLSTKKYEIYAFDAPAHGLSSGSMLTALQYKNFVGSIINHFGPFDAFITHSFGGLAVCMNLTEIDNQNIKTVLIAPAANSKTLVEQFFEEMRISNTQIKTGFYNHITELSGREIDWFSIHRCAPYIKGPVLWIHDLEDPITPVDDAKKLQSIGQDNFKYIFTNNLGHRRIYRDEKVVNAIIDFL